MDRISGFIFSPWLNAEETKVVNAHQSKNFTYVRYASKANQNKELFGRINKITKEVMWADHAPLIGFKCSWILTLGIPVDFLVREVFYATRLKVSDMARVVFYLIGMTFAAIGGILFDPLRARKRIGLIAKKLNQDVTVHEYRQMLRDQKVKGPNHSFTKCIQSFYLAECMQPWVDNIDKEEWIILKTSDDYQEVCVDKKVKECPCTRWFIFPLVPACV